MCYLISPTIDSKTDEVTFMPNNTCTIFILVIYPDNILALIGYFNVYYIINYKKILDVIFEILLICYETEYLPINFKCRGLERYKLSAIICKRICINVS